MYGILDWSYMILLVELSTGSSNPVIETDWPNAYCDHSKMLIRYRWLFNSVLVPGQPLCPDAIAAERPQEILYGWIFWNKTQKISFFKAAWIKARSSRGTFKNASTFWKIVFTLKNKNRQLLVSKMVSLSIFDKVRRFFQ